MPFKNGVARNHDRQGYILMITIIAMMVALVIVVPVLSFVSTTQLTTVKTLERWESYLTREAGIEYGIARLKNDRNMLVGLSSQPLTPVALPLPPASTNEQTVTSLTATLLTPGQWDLVSNSQKPDLETALNINPNPGTANDTLVSMLASGLKLLPTEIVRAATGIKEQDVKLPPPAPAGPGEVDIVKTSQSDFEAAGSTRTNLDTSTTPGDMFLAPGTPGTSYSSGPNLTANVGAGGHTIQRPDNKFLIIRGGNSSGTNIYDPVANSFTTGPTLGGNAGAGAHSIQRPNGTFLVVRGNSTTGTNIYDPVADTMTTGPAFTSTIGAGAHAIQRPNGTFLIVRGNNTITTFIYDPVGNSFSSGPALSTAASTGAHALQRPDGTFLIVRGNSSTSTFIYDPVANSFTAGPALTGNAGAGSHSLQRPDGKFLIIRGGSNTGTVIYDPVANTMTAGPTLSASAGAGSHSFQRADGKFLIVRGNNSTVTNIYDPVANTRVTGPSLPSTAGAGSHSVQRPDGKFLIVRGKTTRTSFIYEAGWFGTGQYISEKLNPASIVAWNTIAWTQTADNTIAFSVKTATTNGGLDSATDRSVTSGGSISPGAGEVWLQVKADYSRAIPTYPLADTK